MTQDSFWNDEVCAAAAQKLARLAEPIPLEVVHVLTERSAVELADLCRVLHVSRDTAVRYLQELEEAGIVAKYETNEGFYYRIADEKVRRIVDILLR